MAVPEGGRSSVVLSHVSDPTLQPFLERSFDPAAYFNVTLPTLSISGQSSRTPSSTHTASLTDVASQTQTLLSQLNAQASRLTTVLTQLTDDIIRSSGRLAYEVDVLRGEALNLSEVVNDTLREDISLFTRLPNTEGQPETSVADAAEQNVTAIAEPQYISQLRMLTKVRQRLDSVIKIFGEAMKWTLPPSEVSIASSFISVSAPEAGSDSQSREQKGKEFTERLRAEVADVVLGASDPNSGLAAAQARIDALRDLAQIWKGTAEEKARIRFIENLTKLAEERARELERGNYRMTATAARRATGSRDVRGNQDGGFLNGLHRLQQSS